MKVWHDKSEIELAKGNIINLSVYFFKWDFGFALNTWGAWIILFGHHFCVWFRFKQLFEKMLYPIRKIRLNRKMGI